MSTKTRHCDECRHWYYHVGSDTYGCLKQHNPRFYQPARIMDNNWGWKRRCEDFDSRSNP